MPTRRLRLAMIAMLVAGMSALASCAPSPSSSIDEELRA